MNWIGLGIGAIGKAVQAFFGYKNQKEATKAVQSTNDTNVQLSWWQFLASQDSPFRKIIRPFVEAYFMGDLIYQLIFTGAYKIITIVPQLNIGGYIIGPITNGTIVTFILLVMFPIRGIEKMVLRKS